MGVIRETLDNGPGVLASIGENASRAGLALRGEAGAARRMGEFQAAQHAHENEQLDKVLAFKKEKYQAKMNHETEMSHRSQEFATGQWEHEAHMAGINNEHSINYMRAQGDVMDRIAQHGQQANASWGPQGASFSINPSFEPGARPAPAQANVVTPTYPDYSGKVEQLRHLADSYDNDSKTHSRNVRQGNPADSGKNAALSNVSRWHAQDIRGILDDDEA